MRHYPLRYFGQAVPMPKDLRNLVSYVQSLRSSLINRTAERCFLIDGGAISPYKPSHLGMDPVGVNLSSKSSVRAYLCEVIAPQKLQVLWGMWEDITPIDIDDASDSIVILNESDPAVAAAALRWDFPTVWRLSRNLSSSDAEHIESLVPQLLAIVVLGHVFQFACTLRNQLHTPTGLPGLDRADHDRSGETLKIGTVCDHFSDNLELAELVISSYTFTSELDGVCGYRDAPRLNGKTAARLRTTGLFAHAKKELRSLQKAHGQDLEKVLDQNVERLALLRDRQLLFIEHLRARYRYNKTFGKIGRSSPTALLYIVIEQAFSFVVEPSAGREWPPEQVALRNVRSAAGNVLSFSVNYSPTLQQRPIIDNLFAAYRFAVLGDDEAIPAADRKHNMRNYVASSVHNPKRHSSRREAPASFKTVMKKFQSNMNGSKQIDTEAKREAGRLRDRLIGIPADASSAFRFVDKAISLYF